MAYYRIKRGLLSLPPSQCRCSSDLWAIPNRHGLFIQVKSSPLCPQPRQAGETTKKPLHVSVHDYATALNQPNTERPRVKEFCSFSEDAVLGQIFYSTQAAVSTTAFYT